MTRAPDPLEARARELAAAAGLDPDARVPKPGTEKTWPAWCGFRDQARAEADSQRAAALLETLTPRRGDQVVVPTIFGGHELSTLEQFRNCLLVGDVVGGALCADGHLGYAQPVGAVVAYDGQISVSGVGYDIACGNMAVRLDVPASAILPKATEILAEIRKVISFGVGRVNEERVEDPLFDDLDAWHAADRLDYREKAAAQLGTVGSGNHYVDLLSDEDGWVWIGVHFGSRGLGHSSATKYLKAAGGKDGIHVDPTVLEETSELGIRYLAAMELAGRYAYAGRAWVVERVRRIVGGSVTDYVHNHHNFAWKERHGGRDLWVVRKGATPAFPGQQGFVGGSMGDDAVIVEGVDTPSAEAALRSTIHGAGRVFGRKEAHRRFTREEMDAWLRERGVVVAGGDIDESPMAYRRLPEVLAAMGDSIKVIRTLRPFAVAMAGRGEFDPWKD
jgi:tRNA-splicing ligase RtcB (3'-phosphate/5'-hydroxy nucleic acid ligase)